MVTSAGGGGVAAAAAADAAAHDASWVFPLLLSCLAGASTCVGAAVVFCFEPSKIRRSMAFSLSLAAAVMITVSIISILPEVADGIMIPSSHYRKQDDNYNNEFLIVLPGSKSVLRTKLLVERLVSFGVGVSAYLLLAKLLVFLPDPEKMFLLDGGTGEKGDKEKNPGLGLSTGDGDGANTNNIECIGAKDNGDMLERGLESNFGFRKRAKRNRTVPQEEEEQQQQHNDRLDRDISQETLLASGSSSPEDFITSERRKRSWRVTLMLFVSLLIHNFPEGLCVAASAKESRELGITVAIGIFIHNVPEGIAISVPCIAARPDQPWLAFWLASFSGLAEPMGAVVALSMLGKTELALENVLAFVAGVMITVAFWELYPEAFKANWEELLLQHQHHHHHQQHKRSSTNNGVGNKFIATNRQPPSEPPASWTKLLLWMLLRSEYRPVLWGTVVGTILMVATELYLP